MLPLQLLLLSDHYALYARKKRERVRERLQDILSPKHWEERVITGVTARCWRRDSPTSLAWIHFHQGTAERVSQATRDSQFKEWQYFSAQIHITVTVHSANNVPLSKISAQVLKVSWLCPGRAEPERRRWWEDDRVSGLGGAVRSDVHSVCSSRKVTRLSFHRPSSLLTDLD